ncbi:MAG: agmatinase family protein, partial [Saprospiraceae bacterium]|nr:agmatinase family protein [Saprospiraceae bacterium]
MSNKSSKIEQFDPNGVGLKNGHFIGLPFVEEEASIVLVSVPWDVTVSYADGTATGPQNILEASTQLDLYDPDVNDAWKMGIFMCPPTEQTLESNRELRAMAKSYIDYLEEGKKLKKNEEMRLHLDAVNEGCENLKKLVKKRTSKLLDQGKLVGIVGGEHSVPLGFLEALAEKHKAFGVLQIDAHMDLRKAYEGFTYSHASIFYNALEIKNIKSLVQVGIRDYCDEEVKVAKGDPRVDVHFDQDLKEQLYTGRSWEKICKRIIKKLPEKVYISFDIDGLIPSLCPNTGTPVPGGLEFAEAMYLIKTLVKSGRKIIGFDLCETG